MTRQHFQALAAALAYTRASTHTIAAVGNACAKFNGSFSMSTFVDYIQNIQEKERNEELGLCRNCPGCHFCKPRRRGRPKRT